MSKYYYFKTLKLSTHSLALYIFYSNLYLDEQKSYPKYDLIIAAVLAFIWLCAASAWAHAVLGLRSIADVEVRNAVSKAQMKVLINFSLLDAIFLSSTLKLVKVVFVKCLQIPRWVDRFKFMVAVG